MIMHTLGTSRLIKAGIIFYILWIISLAASVVNFLRIHENSTNLTYSIVNNKAPYIFIVSLGWFSLGSIFFAIGTVCISLFLTKIKKRNQNSPKRPIRFFLKFLLILICFPFFSLHHLVQCIKTIKTIKKILPVTAFIFVTLVFAPIWIVSYLTTGAITLYATSSAVGYSPVFVQIAGTGSMYPTFPKGTGKTGKEQYAQIVTQMFFLRYPGGLSLFGKQYFNHIIQKGDIISFENKATKENSKKQYGQEAGFIKRVIGLPGDTVELRDGLVYINNQPLKEPYTASAHSTFGEGFLSECKNITIPPHKIFAMGDNRKGSGDSREIGFVDLNDIQSFLSLKDQQGKWDKNWRNTANDFDETSKIKIDKTKYLALLNEKRKEVGIPPLLYEPALEETATKRGQIMLKFDDFSFSATRSGYTMISAMNDVGYFNPVSGESQSMGYFTADELLDNQFAFPGSQKFVLDKQYQDFGLAEVEGEVNGCPSQVIVQHFAGYVPPNYSQSNIASWQKAISNLRDIQPGWNNLKNNGDSYQQHKADIDRINDLISLRIANDSMVLAKMQANQWLNASQQRMTDQDVALANEINALADKLNK